MLGVTTIERYADGIANSLSRLNTASPESLPTTERSSSICRSRGTCDMGAWLLPEQTFECKCGLFALFARYLYRMKSCLFEEQRE